MGDGGREATFTHLAGGVHKAIARGTHHHLRKHLLGGKVDGGRQALHDALESRNGRACEVRTRGAQHVERLPRLTPTRRRGTANVVEDAEHADNRRGINRRVDAAGFAGAVVQRHIAASDRDTHFEARIRNAAYSLSELPHRVRVLGGAEVEAIRHSNGLGARDGDCAVCRHD